VGNQPQQRYKGGIPTALAEALLGPLDIVHEDEFTACICCVLPVCDDSTASLLALSDGWRQRLLPAPTALPSTDVERTGKPTLLVVDDEQNLLNFFATALSNSYDIYAASNGASGLDLALAHHPDLVLTDQNMDGLDGISLCRQLRALPGFETTRILLMTGRTQDAIRLQALEAGADDFLRKPFTIVELQTRLSTMLRSSQLERQVKDRNRALREAQSQLIARERLSALGSLSAGLMHEINNPIHYMVTGLAVLESCCEDRETLADIRDGLDRVQEIIGAVRTFAYQSDETFTPSRPGELFTAVRSLLATQLAEIEFAESADETPVRGSANQLVQVLVNLVQNRHPGFGQPDCDLCKCWRHHGERQRQRHSSGHSSPRFRPLLHDQGSWRRNGSRSQYRPQHHPAARGKDGRLESARTHLFHAHFRLAAEAAEYRQKPSPGCSLFASLGPA
jgi:CheY-like chemotaxis protein